MVAIVTTKPAESPVCPGSGKFPDVVDDRILEELIYVCATCGASVPNFELAPVHRHAVPIVRSDAELSEIRPLKWTICA
jgi:DNA-directed RNA polymerase subunit RPC12/RpoP